jgi:hypothetical protein
VLGRVVKRGEPLWTAEDLAYAKALHQLEADECPGCGHPRSQTTAPDAEGTFRASISRCWACNAAEHATSAFVGSSAGEKGGDPAGLLVAVNRREPPTVGDLRG